MGVSKHFILRSGGHAWLDYQVPMALAGILAPYQGATDRQRTLQIAESRRGWRQRTRLIWQLRLAGIETVCTLTEYSVWPRKGVDTCQFRHFAQRNRMFPRRKAQRVEERRVRRNAEARIAVPVAPPRTRGPLNFAPTPGGTTLRNRGDEVEVPTEPTAPALPPDFGQMIRFQTQTNVPGGFWNTPGVATLRGQNGE